MRFSDPVELHEPVQVLDALQQRTTGWANPVDAVGWLDQDSGGEEPSADGTTTRWDAVLWLPPRTAITDRYEVTVLGDRWSVVGPPRRPRRPGQTTEHHVEARVSRIS